MSSSRSFAAHKLLLAATRLIHVFSIFFYQVYAIEATWSDARKFEIYRRYADFFSLQVGLYNTIVLQPYYYAVKKQSFS